MNNNIKAPFDLFFSLPSLEFCYSNCGPQTSAGTTWERSIKNADSQEILTLRLEEVNDFPNITQPGRAGTLFPFLQSSLFQS